MFRKVKEAKNYIKQFVDQDNFIGIVLGSGLGELAEEIQDAKKISYDKIPNFPHSTVTGHKGRFVIGKLSGKNVIAMQGRFHYYEGYSMEEVVLPIRLMKQLGVQSIIITNAAGGINKSFLPGEFMIIKDHINFFGTNPLIGKNEPAFGPRFPDMSNAYDSDYIEITKKIANRLRMSIHEGVYAGVTGPMYETKSEINMLKIIGADAVGMSTVPEVIAANHLGMKVLGVSCISNLAAGISKEKLSHQEVIETTKRSRESFKKLVKEIVSSISIKG